MSEVAPINDDYEWGEDAGVPTHIPQRMPELYSTEYLRYQQHLAHTDYKEEMHEVVKATHLTASAKRAWGSLIDDFFDKTVFYSKQTDGEMPLIDFEISTVLLRLGCRRTDILNPDFIYIEQLLRTHFENFVITRATGEDRERIMQAKTVVRQERVLETPSQSEKKGFGIIDRIRGR